MRLSLGFSKGVAWLAVLTALSGGARVVAQSGRDWPEYLGGADRNHYSALPQINSSNVANLSVAWEFHSGDFGQDQCNFIAAEGVLYGATASGSIVALDGATGRQLWRFSDPTNLPGSSTDRGVTLWSHGSDRRILCTIGSWLYALDARTGLSVPEFGTGGRANLAQGLGPQAQDKWVVSTTPGTLVGDLLVMPTRVGEDSTAAPGYIQAFDVRTGTVAWVFHTIPFPTERGYETWSKDAYRNVDVGSANCWAGMAVDRERGILYVPTGSAAPDFWGGHRIGQNLYANCLLALDAQTGKQLWHFQIVHHDIWDRDLPAPPNLVTVRHGGKRVAAVAQVTKSGFVFVFDRVTGEPLFPIREVPVQPSTLKGESAWPTQPRPDLPEPFARQRVTESDLSPYAENHDELLARLRALRTGSYQPFGTDQTLLLPGFDGGAEWGGAAADPRGMLYVNANESAWIGGMSEAVKASDLAHFSPGRRLYTQYCVSCHGPDRQGIPASGYPSLVNVGSRLSRDEVVKTIGSGRRMMPGFTFLTASDRQAIAGFLLGDESATVPAVAPAPQNGSESRESEKAVSPYKFNGYTKFLDSKGYPAISPPWGSLTAIDLNTGRRVWRIPLGEFEELTAKGVPLTGTENYGGPMVTAGGLLFIAATPDARFRAFDRQTGRLLWQTLLPAAGFATPTTYEVNGRQYVVMTCGGGKLHAKPGDSVIAFALKGAGFAE